MQQIFQINEKNIREIAESISNEVANKIYYEFLMARYMPEISDIEKGRISPLKGKNAEEYLKQKISLLGK